MNRTNNLFRITVELVIWFVIITLPLLLPVLF